jgi:hypothetical protein
MVASPVLQSPTWGVPILVIFYDMHGLQWDYSFSPVTTWGRNWLELIYMNTLKREQISYLGPFVFILHYAF